MGYLQMVLKTVLHADIFCLFTCSLAEQMEQAALVYLDLLEGRDKPVAGATCKWIKHTNTDRSGLSA